MPQPLDPERPLRRVALRRLVTMTGVLAVAAGGPTATALNLAQGDLAPSVTLAACTAAGALLGALIGWVAIAVDSRSALRAGARGGGLPLESRARAVAASLYWALSWMIGASVAARLLAEVLPRWPAIASVYTLATVAAGCALASAVRLARWQRREGLMCVRTPLAARAIAVGLARRG